MSNLGFWGYGENGSLFSGSTGNYFEGFGGQAHSLGDLESCKKVKKKSHLKGKAFISLIFLKKIFGLENLNVFTFVLTC